MMKSRLNPHSTFDNFIVSATNKAAYEIAQLVASQVKLRYNPVYIHSTVGLGKTHLLNAIGNRISHFLPRVFYRTSEDFLNGYVEACKLGLLSSFRQRLENIDVLLLDDVQLFIDKKSTQLELRRTLSYLADSEKQLVVTSNQPPAELHGLDSGLLDRLRAGLIIQIQSPDMDFKMNFIRHKSTRLRFTVSEDVIAHLCIACGTPREIEGALNVLAAQFDLTQAEPTIAEVRNWFKALEQDAQITFSLILKKISAYFDIKPAVLMSKSNTSAVVLPRSIAMYLARNRTNMSLPEIGRRFDKHHTTVIHSISKISDQRSSEPDFDILLSNLEADLPPIPH